MKQSGDSERDEREAGARHGMTGQGSAIVPSVYDRGIVAFLRGVGAALAHARPFYVLVAVALHLGGLLITGERWRIVVAALGGRVSLARATMINLAGIFVRNATPTTGLGGDASRIALLRAEGVGLPQATASFVYVRVAELPAIAAIVLLALPAVGAAIARSARAVEWTALAAAGVGVGAFGARRRLAAQVASARETIGRVGIGGGAFGAAVLYATIAQLETIVRQIAVAAACGFPLGFRQSATVAALGIAGGLVPTVGSIGAIDGAMVAGLMMCGAAADTAVAVTVVERTISYGLSTALGAGALALVGGRAIVRLAADRDGNAATAG